MTAPEPRKFRCAVLSAVKHDYVARGVASHPRFELVVVADDPTVPQWAHERNQQFADAFQIPYIADVERALREYNVDVAIVSSEAERHCDLSIRAARAGKHVIQDKPLTNRRSESDRLVAAIEDSGVQFMMWNRNCLPSVIDTKRRIDADEIGRPLAVHIDFYFAKDAGPAKGTRRPGYPPMDWLTYQLGAHVDGSDGAVGTQALGELSNEGIYPLAYLHTLTGARVTRVFARSTSHFHQVNADNSVEDLASMSLELEGDRIASITVGRIGLASHPSGGEIKLRILGTKGALVINEACPTVGIYYRGQSPTEARQRRVAIENDFLLAEEFAQAIDHDRKTILDIHASRDIFATVEAALKSCCSGQVEEVK